MEPPPQQPNLSGYLLKDPHGSVHGPFPVSQMQGFADAGQIGPTTLVCREGTTDWSPASQSPDLTFGTSALSNASQQPYPWQQKPSPGKIGAMDLVAPVRADPWAVLAGYLGLFSMILIAAPFSLAVAILALKSLKSHPERTGKGRAWFGLVMGVIGTPLLIWVVLSLLTRS